MELFSIFPELGLINRPVGLMYCLNEEIGKRDIDHSM